MGSLFETFADITRPSFKKEETAHILLTKGLYVDGDYVGVLVEGKRIRIEDSQLVNGEATHKVTSMRCDIFGTKFDLTAIDLKSGELVNVNL